MVIRKERNGPKVMLFIEGRVDSKTSAEAARNVEEATVEATELILDLKGVEYMSSAGLRVLLMAHKEMTKKGGLILRNVTEVVMEVLDITGMADVMNIE